ncbi:uncharacterized protein LOC128243904 [Mya arenaria]|uniref:uncharacterized protein LOC128243904 n=1 Tax=Mya arenaria TaxID=6604 RepID=UPI0022E010F8|nr:uncharacterized protein LOC128243904 [Mya arenaria]XP_052817870.1 uncharacterized protein LOC128243904 [Mya arenaria]
MPVKNKSREGGQWRRAQRMEQGNPEANFELDYLDQGFRSEASLSLAAEIGDSAASDQFQREVANKTRTLLIGRQEAEMEVLTDMIVSKTGNFDRALIYVLGHWKNESKILVMVNSLIHRGANTSAADESLKTPLHFAVEQGLKGVTGKLLENDALPHSRDRDGRLALETALKNENDELAALLLAYMPNRFVRGLFLSDNNKPAEFSLHKLIRSEKLQRTVLSVLDCTIESQGSANSIKVYYGALEADEAGQPPDHPEFKYTDKSCLHVIAKQGNKNIVYHDAVRLLIRKKWKLYAQKRFLLNTAFYMLSLFCITFAAVTSVMAPDPKIYHGTLHVIRAVCEVLLLVMVGLTLLTEINQLRRHRLEYFHDVFNWFDFSASILLVVVVPLRFTDNIAQWHVLAIGYILWTLRIFKYAAVFRQSGAYALILSRILVYDFMQFILVFIVILLAFSVSFYLALRGDSGLNIHDETSTFWGILFVGVRSLTEAAPVVEYAGDNGYGILSMILMLCFLFTCIVILLNILIAQVTDTYQKVQQDAQRGLEVNRAWIVSRVELNSCIFGHRYFNRKTHYKEFEEIKDLKSVLDKWESPPLNEMSKYVRDVWDSIDSHRLSLLTVQQRLARQENTLRDIQEQLSCLVEAVGQGGVRPRRSDTEYGPNTERPRFYRSDTEDGSNTVRPTRLGRES